MLIVADENMPLLEEFFGDLGSIRRVPGRRMATADVAGADLLLVRSVTRVDDALLGTAKPGFVGTATIGTDHIDNACLARRNIPFAAAPGCNARAVAEYVATVLVLFSERTATSLPGLRVGVVGCGHVGRDVVDRLQALGTVCAVNDPLVADSDLPAGVLPMALESLLAWADVVTLHVPLTRQGPAPTWHLLDAGRLRSLRGQLLLNTARGPVVDNEALARLLADPGQARQVVLDVWEDEPCVPPALLARVWLGTPHIAGYSAEGKWRGTAMIRVAAGAALGLGPGPTLAQVLAGRGDAPVELAWQGTLAATLAACCPVVADDGRLRQAVTADRGRMAQVFDQLRREYPERREFSHYAITNAPPAAERLLAALGFRQGC